VNSVVRLEKCCYILDTLFVCLFLAKVLYKLCQPVSEIHRRKYMERADVVNNLRYKLDIRSVSTGTQFGSTETGLRIASSTLSR
jgi:hypothetical protein